MANNLSNERFDLTTDIVEAWNELDELGQWASLGHKVHFDPRKFAQDHPEISREAFELEEDDLRHWAYRSSDLREEISSKA